MRSDRSRSCFRTGGDRRRSAGLLWLIVAAALAGCQPAATRTTSPRAPLAATDPCAERLHEIGGALLLYYAGHARLPEKLADLPPAAGADTAAPHVCPVSDAPYIYDPNSLLREPGGGGRIILYDAQPTHSGMRWALVWDDADGNAPQIARVVALPDSAFAAPAAHQP